MLNINMYDAKTNLSKYAKLIEDKKEKGIVISRGNKPIMMLVPYNIKRKRIFGCAKGKISVPDNFDDIDITNLFEGNI